MPDKSSNNKTVLVVDDEECLLNVTSIILKECGYTVLVAHDGAEAVKIAQTNPAGIDLLLTDMCMPDMEGSQLAAIFCSEYPKGKVVYMTAYAQEEIQKKFPNATVLEKPFDLNTLCEVVAEMLNITF